MSQDFDRSAPTYRDDVERALVFVRRDLERFTEAKVEALLALIRRRLGDPGTMRVLDVGCGVGITDTLLEPHLGELHGVDVASEAVELARERSPGVSYRCYDGSRLPYDDHTFDLTFAICVLHHVPPPGWPAFAAELVRVTKPHGLVATIEHNPLNPLTRLVVSRCEFDDDAVLLTRRRNVELFRFAGLTSIESRYILFFPWQNERLATIERKLAKLPLGAQFLCAGSPSEAVPASDAGIAVLG
jgi:SAM-dependent methyltransferase